MKIRNILFFAFAAILAIGAGCGSAVTITTDYDKTMDFTQIKTFGFLKWSDESAALVNELDRRRVENAVAEEMEKRGIKRVEGLGDSMFGFHVIVENKTGTTSYTDYYGNMGYYGSGGGFGYGYGYPYGGGGQSTTTTSTYEYTIGTIIIDQFESSSKKLMWEGVAQGEVTGDRSNREENIKSDIQRMFANYPIAPPSAE